MRLFGRNNNGRGTQGYASSKSVGEINNEYGTTEVCGLEVELTTRLGLGGLEGGVGARVPHFRLDAACSSPQKSSPS